MGSPLFSALFAAGILGECQRDPSVILVFPPNTFVPLAAAPQVQGHLLPSEDGLLPEPLQLSLGCLCSPDTGSTLPFPKRGSDQQVGMEKGLAGALRIAAGMTLKWRENKPEGMYHCPPSLLVHTLPRGHSITAGSRGLPAVPSPGPRLTGVSHSMFCCRPLEILVISEQE